MKLDTIDLVFRRLECGTTDAYVLASAGDRAYVALARMKPQQEFTTEDLSELLHTLANAVPLYIKEET